MIYEMRTYEVPPGRARLSQDKEWQAFVPTLLPYLVRQESVFLVPAPFSPL